MQGYRYMEAIVNETKLQRQPATRDMIARKISTEPVGNYSTSS